MFTRNLAVPLRTGAFGDQYFTCHKLEVIWQHNSSLPSLSVCIIPHVAYDTLSLDVELDKCIGKGATMFSRLTKRVWLNKKLAAYTVVPRLTSAPFNEKSV